MSENMGTLSRSHYCVDCVNAEIGESIVVAGFVAKVRDKGSLVFVDLRDRSGIVQLTFDDTTPPELLKKAAELRSEDVIITKGIVRERSSKNTEIPTGNIEIFVDELRVLSRAQTPPFEILDEINVNDELKLRYRYLDLRRPSTQNAIIVRHKIAKATRDFYDENGFIEIETPMLIKSTPEGARDYLVPSRVHPGSYYALPQSPQLYKQILMVSGFDKYFQIVRCFRDEDLRADRQPEFTQIDIEMSFVTMEDVMKINEEFIRYLFKKILSIELKTPFKRITYKDAMEKYGSDKPDTRFGFEIHDISDILKNSEFKVFSDPIAGGGSARAINIKGGAEAFSRKAIDKLTETAKTYRAKGLAYTRLTDEIGSSSYEKNLNESEVASIRAALDAQVGDLILIVCDYKNSVVFDSLGAVRLHAGREMGLMKPDEFDFLWVYDFPLFEYDEDEDRFVSVHHPFTSPNPEDLHLLETDPASVRAVAYDMVLNGTELGGGSIRINDPALQTKMFEKIGLDEKTANERFGFLLEAFKYGVPPHGGLAFGLDRIVMLMLAKTSIRDVIAFPKVQNASDLMSGSPAEVDQKSLDDLHIKNIK